jgi:hypothetical protein
MVKLRKGMGRAFHTISIFLGLAGLIEAGVLAEYQADAASPASAAAIQSPTVQGWTEAGTGSGVVLEGVVDAGTNAWRISDDASGSNPSYTTSLSAAELQEMYC